MTSTDKTITGVSKQAEGGNKMLSVEEGKKIFEFREHDGKITIEKYTGNEKDVIIPKKIGEATVTSVQAGQVFDREVTGITLPDSVTQIIGLKYLEHPNLSHITVDANNPVYHSAGDCLIETASKALIWGCKDSVIPDDGSVVSIELGAFENCRDLAAIIIPEGVTTIADFAFRGCGINSISIPKSAIKVGALRCSELTSITVDADNPVYHSAGNCLIETASKTLISGCKSSVIPTDGSVTAIDAFAFADCRQQENLIIPDTVTVIGNHAFLRWAGESVTIPNSVIEIGDYAFCGCNNLTSITLPAGLKEIDSSVLDDCPNLTSITVDADNPVYHSAGNCLIKTARKTVINGCKNSVIPSDGSVTVIGERAFAQRKIESITIPDSVTGIKDEAFNECSNLKSITIGRKVKKIGCEAFLGCNNLESITVDAENPFYCGAGNCLVETAGKTLILGCKNSVIPADGSITAIGDHAFCGCKDLTSITLPDSITVIGYYAFVRCSSLKSFAIPAGVQKINIGILDGCADLVSITVDANNPIYHSAGNCLIKTANKAVVNGCNNSVIPDDGYLELCI